MNKYLSALLLASLLISTGCKQSEAPAIDSPPTTPPASKEPADTSPTSTRATGVNQLLTATPGAAGCATGSVAKFHWDARSNPDIAAVELFVGDDMAAKLFAAGGPVGDAESGPWVYSGTVFVLRDKANGAELDRVVISGPACTPPTQPVAQ